MWWCSDLWGTKQILRMNGDCYGKKRTNMGNSWFIKQHWDLITCGFCPCNSMKTDLKQTQKPISSMKNEHLTHKHGDNLRWAMMGDSRTKLMGKDPESGPANREIFALWNLHSPKQHVNTAQVDHQTNSNISLFYVILICEQCSTLLFVGWLVQELCWYTYKINHVYIYIIYIYIYMIYVYIITHSELHISPIWSIPIHERRIPNHRFFRHKSDERNPAPVARFVSSICFSQEKSRDLQCFLGSQWI